MNADESNYDFAIQGTGVALPEINVKGNGISITDGDVTAGPANNTDMGIVNIASTISKSFVIQNTGAGTLNITGINFTGVNASEFTLVSPPVFPKTVAAGDSTVINVQFAPTATGVRSAEINISSNDADEATYNFAFEGTGAGVSEINVQGNSLSIADGDVTAGAANNTDFGNVNVGATRTNNFVIQNTGTGSLAISGVTFGGTNASEFTVTGTTFPLTIAASSSQPLAVQFKPTAAGVRTATITIANSDGDESTYDFALQGNGLTSMGVVAISESVSFKLYPNPARDMATIAIELQKDAHVTVNVTDVQGREVLAGTDARMKAGSHSLELNTSTLTGGIYFVKIADGTSSTNVKMVIVR